MTVYSAKQARISRALPRTSREEEILGSFDEICNGIRLSYEGK